MSAFPVFYADTGTGAWYRYFFIPILICVHSWGHILRRITIRTMESFCQLQLVFNQACKSSHHPQSKSTKHIQCRSNPMEELWMFQICTLIWWDHIYRAIMSFHFRGFFTLTSNSAAIFCQLWEILRCEYLSIRMWTENITEQSFKKLCFDKKKKGTPI